MTFYDNMAATATRQLAVFGENVVITHVIAGTYSPTSGASNTPSSVTVKGLVTEYSHRQVDGENILTGDKRVYISGPSLSFTPDPTTDKISIGGIVHAIITVRKPVNQNVLWDLQVRRGG